MERLIVRSLWHLLQDPNFSTVQLDVQWLERLIDLSNDLHLNLSLAHAQELYVKNLHSQVLPRLNVWQAFNNESSTNLASVAQTKPDKGWSVEQIHQLLTLGQKLAIDVNPWLNQL